MDAKTLQNDVQLVRFLIWMRDRGEQQCIKHRLVELDASALFFELQETHIESGVMGNQDCVFTKFVEGRQYDIDRRLATHHVFSNAVNRDGFGLQWTFRIDDLIESLLPQQAVVDDAGGADLDDFITIRRLQAGRFSIENRVGQFAELAIKVNRFVCKIEEIKIVILRPTGTSFAILGFRFNFRRCNRQHKAEVSPMRRFFTLIPDLATMPVDHIPERQR